MSHCFASVTDNVWAAVALVPCLFAGPARQPLVVSEDFPAHGENCESDENGKRGKEKKEKREKGKQAGAELCQAQVKLD